MLLRSHVDVFEEGNRSLVLFAVFVVGEDSHRLHPNCFSEKFPESVDVVLVVFLVGQVDGVRCQEDQVAGFGCGDGCSNEVGWVTAEVKGVAGIEGVEQSTSN